MSYENLIDPSGTQAKQRSIFKRANTFDEVKQKEMQAEEEKPDEILNEKEEPFKKGFILFHFGKEIVLFLTL